MPTSKEPLPLVDRLRAIEQDHRKMASQCNDAPVSRENFIEKVGTIVEAIQAVEILDLIDQLRDDRRGWVTIYRDYKESPPNVSIEVGGLWTRYSSSKESENWAINPRRFEGESIIACLKEAAASRTSHLASRTPS